MWIKTAASSKCGSWAVRMTFQRFCGSTIKGNQFLAFKSCEGLRNSRFPDYVPSPHSKLQSAIWREPLQNVYVVKKPWNPDVTGAMLTMIRHLHDEYPAVNILVTDDVANELLEETALRGIHTETSESETGDLRRSGPMTLFCGSIDDIVDKTDLIITLGGDGTILRAVSTFLNASVPPVLSFALGTLGFLLPFDFSTAAETFRMVYESRGQALHRTRLECYVVRNLDVIEPEYSIRARQEQNERSKQVQINNGTCNERHFPS